MSLILEALRKSEAERRRAQAPDLFAPTLVTALPSRRLPPAWIFATAGIALLVLVWVLLRSLSSSQVDASPAAAAPSDTITSATRERAGRITATVPNTPVEPTRPRRLPPAAPPAPHTAPAPSPSLPSRPEPRAQAAIVAPEVAPVPAAPAPAPVPAPAAPIPTAVESGPIRLSELDRASRQQLPPLKLTMHMWNEAAARRFVIVDGRRLVEGDRIGALRIVGIERDGVLLDWNGQALQLPLR